MNWDQIKAHVQDASTILQKNLLPAKIGFTSTGQKTLEFQTDDNHKYRVMSQNPTKDSPAAKLAQQGHEVFTIKDVDGGQLLGYYDATDNKSVSFNTEPISIKEIQQVLQDAGEKSMGASASGSSRSR